MAGLDDGEDFFSDDDLDGLPQNALDELEHNAILYTQHQTQATQLVKDHPSSDYGDGLEDEDLDDAVVINGATGVPDKLQPLHSRGTGVATQREQFRQARYGGEANTHTLSDRSPRHTIPSARFSMQRRASVQPTQDERFQVQSLDVPEQLAADPAIEALQQQVQDVSHNASNICQFWANMPFSYYESVTF
jgi:hypothetical protein